MSRVHVLHNSSNGGSHDQSQKQFWLPCAHSQQPIIAADDTLSLCPESLFFLASGM